MLNTAECIALVLKATHSCQDFIHSYKPKQIAYAFKTDNQQAYLSQIGCFCLLAILSAVFVVFVEQEYVLYSSSDVARLTS